MNKVSILPVVGALGGVFVGSMIGPTGTYCYEKAPLFCPTINSIAQTILKGSGKYLVAFSCLSVLMGRSVYQGYKERGFEPIKKQLFAYETLFSISLLIQTLALCLTHSYWACVLPKLAPYLTDLSDHVLMTTSFASIMAVGINALPQKVSPIQKIAIYTFGALAAIFSFILLLNTTLYYHSSIETLSAVVLSIFLMGFSDRVARALEKKIQHKRLKK